MINSLSDLIMMSDSMSVGNDHSYFLSNPDTIVKKNIFTCSICSKCFAHRGSMYNHLRRIHKLSNIGLKTVKCQEENCSQSFKTTSKLMLHLYKQHCKSFILENLIFQTFDDFKQWKQAIEKDILADYIYCAQNITSEETLIYYKCSRSGFYKKTLAPEERKRKLKSKGSKKSGAHCTSKILVKINNETKTVKVNFCRTHYGHKIELEHVRV